jgi:hypothetical protein
LLITIALDQWRSVEFVLTVIGLRLSAVEYSDLAF